DYFRFGWRCRLRVSGVCRLRQCWRGMKRSPGCWTKGWSVGQVLCLNVWLMLGLARVLGMLSPLGLARVLWMAKLAPGMLAMLARVPRLAMLMVLGLP